MSLPRPLVMSVWVCIQVFPDRWGEFILKNLIVETFMAELQYQIFDGNKIHLDLCGGSVLMGSSAPPLHCHYPSSKEQWEKIR